MLIAIWEVVRKEKHTKNSVSTRKDVKPLVGLFQQSKNRHLLLLSEMKVLMKMINKTELEAN